MMYQSTCPLCKNKLDISWLKGTKTPTRIICQCGNHIKIEPRWLIGHRFPKTTHDPA